MNETMMIQDAHNAFVLENVLDTQGFTSEQACPCCGQAAARREFDELLGGCINQVYSLDCPHCGHHECDREFCSQCEAFAWTDEVDEHEDERLHACEYLIAFDIFKEQLQAGQVISALEWTEFKHALFNEPGLLSWLDDVGMNFPFDVITPKKAIDWLKHQLLETCINTQSE
ncbi:hypothetical protein BTO01_29455 [Vibrio jasicida]|uniref:hypothetical protein n=1 Tax=Vibrio jasicida TaxID=766224 RepID=UPI000CF50883|nr:hypothetical protein [Vibrio jasicida]PQJ44185.1 hypothetical protein BTO01_29455 [Vibrio jasicida]